MKRIETTTLQISIPTHAKLKRGANRSRSKLMPFVELVLKAGLESMKPKPAAK